MRVPGFDGDKLQFVQTKLAEEQAAAALAEAKRQRKNQSYSAPAWNYLNSANRWRNNPN